MFHAFTIDHVYRTWHVHHIQMQHHEERIAYEKAEIFLKEEDESMQLTNKPEQHQDHTEITTTTTTTIGQWSSLTTTTTTTMSTNDHTSSDPPSKNAQGTIFLLTADWLCLPRSPPFFFQVLYATLTHTNPQWSKRKPRQLQGQNNAIIVVPSPHQCGVVDRRVPAPCATHAV